MRLTKCYQYRLRPNAEQEAKMLLFAAGRRKIYNWALDQCKQHFSATGKILSAVDLNKLLTPYKKTEEGQWLNECYNGILQDSFIDLDRAFAAYRNAIKTKTERKVGYPKYRSYKKTKPSFRYSRGAKIVNGGIHLPKIGRIKSKIDRIPDGETKTATVKRYPDGRWFVSFIVHTEVPDVVPTCNNPIGIDLGLKTLATLSNEKKYDQEKFLRNASKRMARLQRKFARSVKGSKNQAELKLKLAKLHQKIVNSRENYQHKISKEIVKNHDTICIEDLNVAGMKNKKRHLGKSFGDAALSGFKFKLEYKAKFNLGQVVKVGRYYPSSKTCSHCNQKTNLTLDQRCWTCNHCKTNHDRDVNAAINILAEGIRILSGNPTKQEKKKCQKITKSTTMATASTPSKQKTPKPPKQKSLKQKIPKQKP